MPIYLWKCPQCGQEKEKIMKINDSSLVCEKCKVNMEKQIGLFGFRLKGGCWAKDGYCKGKCK